MKNKLQRYGERYGISPTLSRCSVTDCEPPRLPSGHAAHTSLLMALLLSKHAYGTRVPWREQAMRSPKATKRSRKAPKKRTKPSDKEAVTNSLPATAPQVENVPVADAPARQPTTGGTAQPKAKPADLSARTAAIRRSTEGKFNKVILTQIGGAECPRFYPMTWKERDAFMAKPENAAVRDRYEKHLASVTA
jgi:hypothetical protein